MVNSDWSKLFEVIILRESPEDNLIICYYDFGELLFFKKLTDKHVRTDEYVRRTRSPLPEICPAREFELEPANDWLTVTLSARLSGPIGEKNSKERTIF